MEHVIRVFKKLLLTANWLFFGGVGAFAFITSKNLKLDQNNGYSNYVNEWWYPFITMFFGNPGTDLIIGIGIGCFVAGIITHLVISWIFS
tara:strand:- start:285 stop:554 length:270 start_codon:yes stop_codon:yes gene_type:complete